MATPPSLATLNDYASDSRIQFLAAQQDYLVAENKFLSLDAKARRGCDTVQQWLDSAADASAAHESTVTSPDGPAAYQGLLTYVADSFAPDVTLFPVSVVVSRAPPRCVRCARLGGCVPWL